MIADYLTFTFAKNHEPGLPDLVRRIDPDAAPIDSKTGYTADWSVWGSGRLQWGHRGDVSARLNLPGKALALLRESDVDVKEFVIMILEAGAKCTRVDYAFDWGVDASPMIDRIVECIRAGHYTSRWRLQNPSSCRRTYSVCGPGDTLYLGSAKSDCFLRIYDKAAERKEAEPRIRFELEVRKERANAAIVFLTVDARYAVEDVKSIILSYFDVKSPVEDDENKSRWPTANWWAALWGRQKAQLTLGSDMPTEDDSRAWFERLGPSLALLLELDDGDLQWLLDAITRGRTPVEQGGRWRSTHEAKLRAWTQARLERIGAAA